MAVAWYIGIGLAILIPPLWSIIEPRLRPVHVAEIRAGHKCIRCGRWIRDDQDAVRVEGYGDSRAHLDCEEDRLAGIGCNAVVLILLLLVYLIGFVVVELPEWAQGNLDWRHLPSGRAALLALGPLLSSLIYFRQRRRRLDALIARAAEKTKTGV